jgi:hypothetical protein
LYNDIGYEIPEKVKNNFFELAKGHEEIVGVKINGNFMYFEEIDGELFLFDGTAQPIAINNSFDFSTIEDVAIEETVIDSKKTDTSLNQANEKIIIQSYADVFNNFVSLKADLNSFTLDQAVEQFKLETSKCK